MIKKESYYRNTRYYNLEAWNNHSINIMFIAGYSGSGKTTLGRKLAEYYNCYMYELDGIHKEIVDVMGKEFVDNLKFQNPYKWNDYMMEYVINKHESKYGKEKQIILEGIRVHRFDMEKYKRYPMVILGTGIIQSTVQAFIRAFRKEYIKKYGTIDLSKYIDANKEYYGVLEELRNFMDTYADISEKVM